MTYIWSPQLVQGGDVTFKERSWEDRYVVYGYVPTTNPVWVDLQADRYDLAPGSYHPVVPGAMVDSFRVERLATTNAWEVTVSWKSILENEEEENDEWQLPPTQRAARVTMSSERQDIQTFKVYNDDDEEEWLLNSLGDLMYDAQRPITFFNFNVTKSMAFLPSMMLEYPSTVNNDNISLKGLTFAPGYLLFQDLQVSDVQREQVDQVWYSFVDVSFVLTYNPNGWRSDFINRGLRCTSASWYPNTTGNIGPCRNGDEDATEPMFLDQDGGQISDSLTVTQKMAEIDTALIQKWVYRRKPFNVLPIN